MRLIDILNRLPAKYLAALAGRFGDARGGRTAMAAEAHARLLAPGLARERFGDLRPEARLALAVALESPEFCPRDALLAALSAEHFSPAFLDPALTALKREGFVFEMAQGKVRGVFVPDDLVPALLRLFPKLYEARLAEWETRYALLPPLVGYAADLRVASGEALRDSKAAELRLAERLKRAGRDATWLAERIRDLVPKVFSGADVAADLAASADLPARIAAGTRNVAEGRQLPPALRAILSGAAETLDLGVMSEPAPDAFEAAQFLWNAGLLAARAFDRRLPVVVRRAALETDPAPFAADPARPDTLHVVARPPFAGIHLLELVAVEADYPGVISYIADRKRARAAVRVGLDPAALALLPEPFADVVLGYADLKKRRKAKPAADPPAAAPAEIAGMDPAGPAVADPSAD